MSLTPEILSRTYEKAGLTTYFPERSFVPLVQFTLRMLQINKDINLTKWTKEQDVLTHHLLDSAMVLPQIKPFVKPGQKWMDLGSGCGFPGVVLLGAFPEVEITFLDSVTKKTKALQECLQAAKWKASLLTDRAERAGRNSSHREHYDGVVARAVADFRVVLEYATSFLKIGGHFVNWMTSGQLKSLDQAHPAFEKLQCKMLKTTEYRLPGLNQSRYLVLVEKWGKTPASFPRAVGRPSKDPL